MQFDYVAAKVKLAEAGSLDPDNELIFGELGDVERTNGTLEAALAAFQLALAASRRKGVEANIAVLLNRVGDVLVAQGNLPDALTSFRDGLMIIEALSKADPENLGWRHDWSCP